MFTKKSCYLIAEIGWNFLGNTSLAKKMIIAAKNSGADFVKFQIWNPKYLKEGAWDNDGRKEIYNKAFLNKKKYEKLNNFCKKNKIKCFSSIFSETEIEDYHKVTKDMVKIPSPEAYNLPLIKKCLKKFDYIVLSLGALKKNELKKVISITKNKKVIPMHCVSSYPLKASDCNFYKFEYLKKFYKKVGYSGHFDGVEDAIYAIDNGAVLIEKHFTTNNDLPGRDNKFALLPKDFSFLSNYIKTRDAFKENKGLDLQKCEVDIYKNYRGRWQKKVKNSL